MTAVEGEREREREREERGEETAIVNWVGSLLRTGGGEEAVRGKVIQVSERIIRLSKRLTYRFSCVCVCLGFFNSFEAAVDG